MRTSHSSNGRLKSEIKQERSLPSFTDVDRAACVGADGEEINRNTLIALISGILLKEKSGVIVTDSVTSDSLTAAFVLYFFN